jgi:hypothetical protein
MKLFCDNDGKGETVIILDKKEGQALCAALTHATEPPKNGKHLNKRSAAWKVAFKIAEELAVW